MKSRRAFLAGVFIVLATALVSGTGITESTSRLRLATTTSTENSGLLYELLLPFEAAHNVVVDVIAVGTGAALELGRNGDVDVVIVHAPALEQAFVAQGYGLERVGFMYNDFVLLGPPDDPARVTGARSVAHAFTRIAGSESLFISRGDNSGTHAKELSIWRRADLTPSGQWYREVGQGMGAVIAIADNEQAYALADRGTYLALRGESVVVVLFEGDPLLFNPYAVIAVNPQVHPQTESELAQALVDYLLSEQAQRIIGSYRVEGELLFTPDAQER